MKSQLSWKEYRALEFSTEQPAKTPARLGLKAKLNHLWQRVIAYLNPSTEPHVWQTEDSTGQVVWNAYDPVTRQSVEQVSASEMRVWLEERHYQAL
jgi:hypothetical protein